MNEIESLPRLYRDLADWWPVLSDPGDYAEEAEFYRKAILTSCEAAPRTVLELGSGGGNNASHLKKHFQMTLVDLAPGMLAVSRKLNPECEHLQGDMRTVRLGRQFDAVFIHDAIVYMTTAEDLRRALRTAFEHCKPGGVALFAPDSTYEKFKPSTRHGGHDRGSRSLRYLQWEWDPDPADTTTLTVMIYVLREGKDNIRTIEDRHNCGLFRHAEWLRLMSEVGFAARSIPFVHSKIEPGYDMFIGLKPEQNNAIHLVPASLVPPAQVRELLMELGDGEQGFSGTPFFRGEMTLEEYLQSCCDGADPAKVKPGLVPQTIYWVVDGSGVAVGMVRLRHRLNDKLLLRGGHIGFYIRPAYRRRGCATQALRLALEELKKLGEPRALLTVHVENAASIRIIESCGGKLENIVPDSDCGTQTMRFWIALK